MNDNIKLAWRNIWRSKTRTILTASLVFIVVILSTMMSSQQFGMYDNMIDNLIEFSGHIQIQDTNYREKRTINYVFDQNDSLIAAIRKVNHVESIVPRVESGALASYGIKTKYAFVLGIDPQAEDSLSHLSKKIVKYRFKNTFAFDDKEIAKKLADLSGTTFVSEERLHETLETIFDDQKNDEYIEKAIKKSKINSNFLSPDDEGVIIGERMAKYLNIGLGDTLVLISQGYQGRSAEGLFPVKGIIKFPMAEIEKRLIIMDLGVCQEFYSTGKSLTSLLIKIDKNENLNGTNRHLNKIIPDNLVSATWEKLQPEMVQMIESDKAGGVFMKGIFYMIVGFIIFGTIMMMMAERKKEFGILVAIGLKRTKLTILLLYEIVFIAFMGTVLGFVLSFPVINYFHKNPIPLKGEMAAMMEEYGFEPIIFFSRDFDIFYRQAITIFIVTLLVFIFPLIRTINLNIIKSMRG